VSSGSVLLIGAHGHGLSHLRNIRRRELPLVAVCDTQQPHGETAQLLADTPYGTDAAELLARHTPDVVVIATPIHTHLSLAELALRSGADVLLEKPPVPQTADFRRLTEVVAQTGRACQVGFQSFGSGAVERLRTAVATGELGRIHGIGAVGAWVRTNRYWQRSNWAGRRQLRGIPVVDGAVTNPFAHAVAAALRIAGSDRLGDLARVEAELFHANPIEADDTSSVRITTNGGITIAIGLTLCAKENQDPYLTLRGERGQAQLWYTRDELRLNSENRQRYDQSDLLTNLIAYRNGESEQLIAPLERTGAFTEVVDKIRTTEPKPIDPDYVEIDGTGLEQRRIVTGIEPALEQVATELRLLSELNLPWAV
jgi:predicted dehydrogenase